VISLEGFSGRVKSKSTTSKDGLVLA
jgi:hypothetical protein